MRCPRRPPHMHTLRALRTSLAMVAIAACVVAFTLPAFAHLPADAVCREALGQSPERVVTQRRAPSVWAPWALPQISIGLQWTAAPAAQFSGPDPGHMASASSDHGGTVWMLALRWSVDAAHMWQPQSVGLDPVGDARRLRRLALCRQWRATKQARAPLGPAAIAQVARERLQALLELPLP